MAQKQILLPETVALRLHIAMLEGQLAQVQAQLLMATGAQQQAITMARVLHEGNITLPVPLAQCSFDMAQGALIYEEQFQAPGDGAYPIH